MLERSTRIIQRNGEYHHCASLVQSDGYFWLAFYNGRECTREQRVVIQLYDEGLNKVTESVLGSGTGIRC